MNELLKHNYKQVEEILARYPADQKRSAVMPLLYLAQRKNGYITRQSLGEVAEISGLAITEVVSIVGFYSLYHDESEGHARYRIQVCTDLPCALRGADAFLRQLCQNIGVRVGEPTPDGAVVVEEVTCLAGCHRAPMMQVQGDGEIVYHEDQTVESALKVVEDLHRRAAAHQPREEEA